MQNISRDKVKHSTQLLDDLERKMNDHFHKHPSLIEKTKPYFGSASKNEYDLQIN